MKKCRYRSVPVQLKNRHALDRHQQTVPCMGRIGRMQNNECRP